MNDMRTREAVRYLGYGKNAIDEPTLLLIRECFKELDEIAAPGVVRRTFKVKFLGENEFIIGKLVIHSADLGKAIRACESAVLFCVTLGIAVDRKMRRYELMDMAKAVVFQACAAVVLEEYCDRVQVEIEEQMWKEGLYSRPRYSPGYGDFSILYQKDILSILETAKTIGVAMTEGYMLTPSKSVTAIIGFSRKRTMPPPGV